MHKLVTLLAAAALLAAGGAVLAAPQTSAQAPADVNLSIEQYVSMQIVPDTLGMTAKSGWFEPGHGPEHGSAGGNPGP